MLDLLKKLTGASIWTSVIGYIAIIMAFIVAGGDILENFSAWIDSDPLTIVDKAELTLALEKFGLGSVAGFLGIAAKDNGVSTEDVLKHKNKA